VPRERHVIFSFPNAAVARVKVQANRTIVLSLGSHDFSRRAGG